MKKLLVLLIVAALAVSVAACSSTQSSSSSAPASTPSESVSSSESASEALPDSMPEEGAVTFEIPEANQKLGDILTAARNAEDNEYFPPVLSTEDPQAAMIFELMGLKAEDVSSFAISVSPMNVKAYGVAIVKPAEGKNEVVMKALGDWVVNKQKEFENYLPDQFEIAKSAVVTQSDDGTTVLVMCENAADVQKAIGEGLQKA